MITNLTNMSNNIGSNNNSKGISLYSRGGETAWGSSEYSIRQGCVVHFAVLKGSAGGYGYRSGDGYHIPSSDRWADGESKPDHGGYDASLCVRFWEELGGSPAVCGVLLQQQLPGEHRYGTL